ncbi:unnamed protein product, partial [Allacma fusca]
FTGGNPGIAGGDGACGAVADGTVGKVGRLDTSGAGGKEEPLPGVVVITGSSAGAAVLGDSEDCPGIVGSGARVVIGGSGAGVPIVGKVGSPGMPGTGGTVGKVETEAAVGESTGSSAGAAVLGDSEDCPGIVGSGARVVIGGSGAGVP